MKIMLFFGFIFIIVMKGITFLFCMTLFFIYN